MNRKGPVSPVALSSHEAPGREQAPGPLPASGASVWGRADSEGAKRDRRTGGVASGNGLGIRSKRYSMLVEDGVVKKLNLEPAPGKVEVSGGDTLLGQL